MRKSKKNKIIIIIIAILIIALYFSVQKIKEKSFNEDIFTSEEDHFESEEKNDIANINEQSVEDEKNANISGDEEKNNEKNYVYEDEIDTDITEEVVYEGSDKNTNSNLENEISKNNKESKIDEDIEKIYIYVTGEVNNRGVVILNKGSRVIDAIETAGGVTNNANISKINLVFLLQDGMKINIPSDEDLKNNPNFEYIVTGSGDSKNDSYTIQNNNTSRSTDFVSSQKKKNNIININTATQTELETLPGIGPSLALKIINYRAENGKFSNISDIKNVSGIGESKFNEIKDYIVVN